MTLALIVLAPVLIAITYSVLGGLGGAAQPLALRIVLMVDLVYIILVAGLIVVRLARTIAARRARSTGARLHLRLVQMFMAMALVPTVVIAIFATVTLNFGLEGWFSTRVQTVLSNALAAAEAYKHEHEDNLRTDTRLLAGLLNEAVRSSRINAGEFRQVLEAGQVRIQRGLSEAYVIDGKRDIQARGERSYLFGYVPPSAADIAAARLGQVVIIEDWEHNEFRALAVISALDDGFLYVSREVDGEILSLLDQTRETVRLYQQLESTRGRLLFEFGLIYLGVALIVILAAVWAALLFAERLARPVGRLAGAAERVGAGDFDVKVREIGGDDEIALLGRAFNRMTRQVKAQRDELVAAHDETETRRRLFDEVLSGVTAGVIGLDASGDVALMNAAAARMLGLGAPQDGASLARTVPEFAPQLAALRAEGAAHSVRETDLLRNGQSARLLVRMAARQDSGTLEGYVITFDDITELVAAQRMAAWGDVARRIAHEIKNPLTPIKLSAERMRRKFGPQLGAERPALEQMSDVIIRQTEDLRRIVDEFSRFARMPRAELREADPRPVVRDALALAQNGHPAIGFSAEMPEDPLRLPFDETMLSQALNNLLKNAAEAVAAKGTPPASVRVQMQLCDGDALSIAVQDTGTGLPEQRANLIEPYVTHRDKGTGLGLSIVKKIAEEHGGRLVLGDAPLFDGAESPGASVTLILPGVQTGTPAKPKADAVT